MLLLQRVHHFVPLAGCDCAPQLLLVFTPSCAGKPITVEWGADDGSARSLKEHQLYRLRVACVVPACGGFGAISIACKKARGEQGASKQAHTA